MKEQDWLAGHNFYGRALRNLTRNQHRKWGLFAAACCRRAIPWTGEDDRLRPAVEAVESLADGLIEWDGVRGVRRTLSAIRKALGPDPQGPKAALDQTACALDEATAKKPSSALYADETCRFAFRASLDGKELEDRSDPLDVEAHQQWLLARCVFGNPFRPVAFDPRWRSESAVSLARTAYDTRNFSLLPVLADALEEAGCDHPDVLTHCRRPGPHARGCWVVDGVLNKANGGT